MGLFDFFKNKKKRTLGNASREQAVNRIMAAYQDVAGDDPAIARHFEDAKAGSHAAIFDKTTRDEIMEKARFEITNNPNLKGIVNTKAQDVIGRQPKLRFLPDESRTQVAGTAKDVADSLSAKFASWAKSVNLGEKLRTACTAKIIDGESFLFVSRNKASNHPLQLDIRLFDPERVADDPFSALKSENRNGYYDGIKYDAFDNPVRFHVAKDHPQGDTFNQLSLQQPYDYFEISNKYMFHWFRKDRPEQRRGVSELASALPVASVLRRVKKAVALSNEIAASISFLLETNYDGDDVIDSNGNTVDSTAYGGFSKVSYEAGTSMILPDGVTAKQLDSKHPNTSYLEFHNSCINDIGRSIGLPYNKAAGNSSSYNYSSARLDHLSDEFGNTIIREELINQFLDPIVLRLWIAFALETDGYCDAQERAYLKAGMAYPKHSWSFDSIGHIDAVKEAKGKSIECAAGSNNRAHLLMAAGFDVDTHDTQAAEAYGFESVEEYRKAVAFATFGQMQAEEQPEQQQENDQEE